MPIKIGNKDYKTVAERMIEFHEARSEDDTVTIETEIVEMDSEKVIMKTTITQTKKGQESMDVFSGYAQEIIEKTNKSHVNYVSYLENCETSAIGRALAAAGYSGSEYASAEEMKRIQEKTEAKARTDDERTALTQVLRTLSKKHGVQQKDVQLRSRQVHGATVASLNSDQLNEMIDYIKEHFDGEESA